MLKLTRRLRTHSADVTDTLRLTYHERTRSRHRVVLASGRDAALMLERGYALRDGELLTCDRGDEVIRIEAAEELLSVAHGGSARELARVAYHLGNRHVSLQIGENFVSYLHDHVLDDMVSGLGVAVKSEKRKFEPEAGAYAQGHEHGHREHSHEPALHGHVHTQQEQHE